MTAFEQGAGRVDVARAITQTVTTVPVGLSFGRTMWPHGDDVPVVRTVTYHNPGAEPVTLQLSMQVTGPGGVVVPSGMFQVSATQVTVPAGGQAQVTVTADTSVESPDGHYTGRLLATAGSTVVNTPLAVNKEPESYNLTLTFLDRTGALTGDYMADVLGLDEYRTMMPYEPDGSVTIRLPKGRYGLNGWLFTLEGSGFGLDLVVQPELSLSRDTTVTFDARQARPVEMTIPDRTATLADVTVAFGYSTPSGRYDFSIGARDFVTIRVGQLGQAAPASQFASSVAGQWAQPDGQGGFDHSPYLYTMTEATAGRMPVGAAWHYRKQDLVTVRHEFRGTPPTGTHAKRSVLARHPVVSGSAPIMRVAVPGERVEYYNDAKGMRWDSVLDFFDEDWNWFGGYLSSPSMYQAGRHYQERWNGAPYGPAFSDYLPTNGITRQGDTIGVDLPLFSDSAGHAGDSVPTSARTALYRNGVLVGETGDPGWGMFVVPPGRASYR
ncbi:peptidase S8, partial [Micromonospora sonneratiae]